MPVRSAQPGAVAEAGGDEPGMQTVGGDAAAREAARQLAREKNVAQLGGAVATRALLLLQVLEVEPRAPMGRRCGVDHPGAAGRAQPLEQQMREHEVRHVVGREHELEAVLGALVARGDQAGVVHQHVDPRLGGGDLGGDPFHFPQARQVGMESGVGLGRIGGAQLAQCLLRAARVARNDDDAGPLLGQTSRRDCTDAGGCTGDDDGLTLHPSGKAGRRHRDLSRRRWRACRRRRCAAAPGAAARAAAALPRP